jgi:hypothetical protein
MNFFTASGGIYVGDTTKFVVKTNSPPHGGEKRK